jgi:CheY-like chemotaxis protein
VEGVVQRCTHQRGTLHEIGIKFRQPIELARYISADRAVIEHVSPRNLAGLALLAVPSAQEVESFKRLLEGTSVRVRDFRTGAELLAHGIKDVSIIVCGDSLPDMTGVELLARVRKAEADVPVLIISNKPAGADAPLLRRQRAVMLQRPLSGDGLLRTIAELTLIPPPTIRRVPASRPRLAP